MTALTLQRQAKSPWIVLAAALTLAFAPLFWSQALITEVYTTAAFFAALANYELRSAKHESRITNHESRATGRRWVLSGFVCGLGLAVHPTLVFLMPLWLFYLFFDKKEGAISTPLPLSISPVYRLPSTVYLAGLAIGLLPYALLPLLGPWPQPWGDVRTFAGWWDVVTARLYQGYAFGLPLAEWPARVAAWAALMARQFTPVGGALVLLGGWLGWRIAPRGRCWGWRRGRPAEPVRHRLRHVGFAAVSAAPVAAPDPFAGGRVALAGGERIACVGDVGSCRWCCWRGTGTRWTCTAMTRQCCGTIRVLAATPADAVLITTQGDPYTFALWYAQEAVGLREDVLVIDRNLWWQESYRQFLFVQTGREVAVPEDYAAGRPLCRIVEEGVACP